MPDRGSSWLTSEVCYPDPNGICIGKGQFPGQRIASVMSGVS